MFDRFYTLYKINFIVIYVIKILRNMYLCELLEISWNHLESFELV